MGFPWLKLQFTPSGDVVLARQPLKAKVSKVRVKAGISLFMLRLLNQKIIYLKPKNLQP